MKQVKNLIVLTLILVFGFSNSALAVDVEKVALPTSSWYFWVKITESIKLDLLTFGELDKANVLDEFTDKRVDEMSYADSIGDDEAIKLSLEHYETQKQKALEYAKNASDQGAMDQIRERTLEQQRIMTQLQLRLKEQTMQEEMVKVQQRVEADVESALGETKGRDDADKFESQTRTLWYDPETNLDEKITTPPSDWKYSAGGSALKSGGSNKNQGGKGN
ncbi:DUF5667 domain-containing protein [Patescibacteria group bacterium]